MAVELTATSANFTGTGVSSTYAAPIYANNANQIQVSVDGGLQTLGDNYVLNGVGSEAGVNIVATFTSGAAIFVERVTPIKQEIDTKNNETILEDVLDLGFDKLTLISQEIDGKANRAIFVPRGENGILLPPAAERVGYAGWVGGDLVGVPLPSNILGANILATATSTALLAALVPVLNAVAYLDAGGRSGLFVCRVGAPPASDVLQGLYVSSVLPGFYWERAWDKVNGQAAWFGAVADDVTKAAANLLAFHAAKVLCTVTHLGVGEWYINDTLVLDVNSRRFQGAFMGIEGGPNGTRLVQTNNTKDIVRIGGAIKAQSKALIEAMDFGVRWATDPVAPADPAQRINAPKGFVYQHVLAFRSERCFVLDGLIGHFYHDTVNSKCIEPGFTRTRSLGTNDFLIGHWVHGPASASGYAGGNATLFLRDLNVTLTQTGLAIDQPTGLYCDTDFADLFVDGIETSQINFGIVADGTGADYVNGHGDVHLRRLVFDQCKGDGIWIKNCHKNLKLHIDQFYIQLVDAGGNKGIHLEDNEFFATIANGQIAGGADNTTTYGIYTNNQPNCVIDETVIIESVGRPISMNGTSDGGYIGASVGVGQANSGGTRAAVAVAVPVGMIIEPNVRGPAGAWSEGILLGTGGSNTFVNPTRVDRAACAGNRRLVINSVLITARGDYTGAGAAGTEAARGINVVGYVG